MATDRHLASALARSGRAHHGLVDRRAPELAITRSQLYRLATDGHLEQVHRGVHRHGGAPTTHRQALLAAVMAGGDRAAASHHSAAALWQLLPAWPDMHEITVPDPGDRGIPGVVVHRSRDLTPERVVQVDRIRVTNPMLTLLDLAIAPASQVEDALERALVSRLASVVAVEALLRDVARRGPGTPTHPRSAVEALLRVGGVQVSGHSDASSISGRWPTNGQRACSSRNWLASSADTAYRSRAISIESLRGRLVARVDFAYPHARLAIEVDGFGTHSSPRALQADLRPPEPVGDARLDSASFHVGRCGRAP